MKTQISLLCACLLLASCDSNTDQASAPQQPSKVDVITLKPRPVTLTVDLPGRTTSIRTAEVRPQVSGIILKRLFKEGSEVKAGQQLYQIDPSTYEASWEKAHAQRLNSEFVLNRYKSLLKSNAVSKQTYDEAVSDFAQAKADEKTAQVNLEYTKVRAPISGRIGRSSVTEGALVTDGQTTALATITQINPIYVDVSQSTTDLLKLRKALEGGELNAISPHEAAVKLTLEDGTPYSLDGKLEFAEVQVDEGTGTVTLRAQFPNPNGVLLPGMFVHSQIKQGVEEKGLMVPQASVMHNNKGRPYVYVVDKDNKIKSFDITTGKMQNGWWQVTSGLKENQRVVLSGGQFLSNDEVVEPVEHQTATDTDTKDTPTLSTTDKSAQ
ncbi:efflux RND transporter periplasmic adaptor subunit [Klebsiella quasipneumoniae subsp. quasipneumoniae]|uniref:efflux RND transporter periplasmic adaptor subunit n=1 Tax=Klebsiella quasipneumoniae TaxID=1463165 RepID=UPI001E33245B|nr:efflux RND transporter periplasmic adaptor subunit [Klebsiella quasipneumoniae]MCD7095353.1 efflux RND transporter periplasmic adaptor subunit [Klebsiella quasipneumoniae subsp. similipneumoniae]